eukprot:9562326-Alexandrium_andersonii.AAC.1
MQLGTRASNCPATPSLPSGAHALSARPPLAARNACQHHLLIHGGDELAQEMHIKKGERCRGVAIAKSVRQRNERGEGSGRPVP